MTAYSNPQPSDPRHSRLKAALLARGASGTLLWFLILTGAIIALTLIANRCGDDDDGGSGAVATVDDADEADEADEAEEESEPEPAPEPVAGDVTLAVDGDTAVLSGVVPDQATADALMAAAESVFGPGNVTNNLTIDPNATTDGATLTITGTTDETTANGLTDTISNAYGATTIDDDGLDITAATPGDVEAELDGAAAVLRGVVPDQATADALMAAAESVLGVGNVTNELTIDPNATADGATVTLTGTAEEQTAARLAAALADAYPGVTLDDSGLDVVASTTVVDELNTLFTLNPVQFASGSAEILPESIPVLDEVAALLATAPGLRLQVEGHTDTTGDADSNLVLSQNRATAVVEYLVGAGASADQLEPVGRGETAPIADDSTPEGQQTNRRIEFVIQEG